MRSALISIAGIALLWAAAAPAAADAYADAAQAQAGTAYTPSGMGDPDAIVCRAPQTLPGGGRGPKTCMRNKTWARLTLTGQDLGADGRSVFERPMVDEPGGEGEPGAVTCRKPPEIVTGWHLRSTGPEICLTNATWAQLKADHMRVSEDGKGVIDTRRESRPIMGPLGGFDPGISALPTRIVR